MVAVGTVLRAHGVRGEVLIAPDSENPARFGTGSELFARTGQGSRRLKIASGRRHRGMQLVRFAEVLDRNGAEALRGAVLEVSQDDVPAAADGAFYYFQLVGCRVVDGALGDLGEVTDVVEDGGGVLLEVGDASSGARRPLLVPFVSDLLPEVNVAERLIRSELPEGLVEACGSTS